MGAQVLLDVLFIEEEVEHGDVSHGDNCVPGQAPKQEGVSLVLHHHQVILPQIVHLLYLRYPRRVRDLAVVLLEVRSTEENYRVLPLVTDPAFAALHPGPLGTSMYFEVCVFRISIIEDQLRVAQLASDHKWLDSGLATAKTPFHVTLKEVPVLLHIPDLNSVGDLSSRILISEDHIVTIQENFLKFKVCSWASHVETFLIVQPLLYLYLEACRWGLFELSWVQFASKAELLARVVTFDAKDHQQVRLHSLRYVVVRQVNRLQSLTLRNRPL